jgi:hypothetical protein
VTLRLDLGGYLRRQQLTVAQLVSELNGRVKPRTIQALAGRLAQRINLQMVWEIMQALNRLTGGSVRMAELIVEVPEP